MLTGFLAFPSYPLCKGMIQGHSLNLRALINTATAIPAFIRKKYKRRLPLFRIWDEHVAVADIYASVAARTDFGIENKRPVRGNPVGSCIDLFLFHNLSPFFNASALTAS